MFNDKMDIDDMMLDLSTRASNFCEGLVVFQDKNITLKFDAEKDIVCVSVSSQASVPNFWQVWFEVWVDGVYYFNKKFDANIQEGNTLRRALVQLDDWLDGVIGIREFDEMILEQEASNIIESIGFGD